MVASMVASAQAVGHGGNETCCRKATLRCRERNGEAVTKFNPLLPATVARSGCLHFLGITELPAKGALSHDMPCKRIRFDGQETGLITANVTPA
ncbi:MAG: hypothetical protein ABTS16_15270 [Candidatus Accumulibacter phosphatis]|uniref:Uncharacterized protein n=2 Tax=Candidatus Accumulibacter contiguus TaxID=2954381 RepID=A0ABX1TCX8_9PROT|nr:hypothetical protein [Candidatus Accumulibacter contiguus]